MITYKRERGSFRVPVANILHKDKKLAQQMSFVCLTRASQKHWEFKPVKSGVCACVWGGSAVCQVKKLKSTRYSPSSHQQESSKNIEPTLPLTALLVLLGSIQSFCTLFTSQGSQLHTGRRLLMASPYLSI